MKDLSRREFVALTAAGAVAGPIASTFALGQRPAVRITAGDIVERIKQSVGVPWNAGTTVDTFKAGDPSTVVTGVVVTSMATLAVLQQAVKVGANFVITSAPTFYSRADSRQAPGSRGAGPTGARAGGPAAAGARGQAGAPRGGGANPSPATVFGPGTGASAPMPPTPSLPQSIVPLPQRGAGDAATAVAPPDPVYAGKNAFIDKNSLIIFRLTEHWNARKPDPRAAGLATVMGWTRHKTSEDALRYDVPPITLEALASQLKKVLAARASIRAIGDRTFRVQKVGLLPGFTPIQASLALLPSVDVMIAGEVQEWEGATYAQDVVFSGLKKGFISIGRVVNEATGMQVCADWLKTLVPEVPVRFISAGDPYWRPL
jgi:putative NIF3 family GTP cyclohydrolase 1 type 2